MLVDCGTCTVRGLACGDCVVTVLWGLPDDEAIGAPGSARPADEGPMVRLDADDRRALQALADAGMAPRLRHAGGRERDRRAAS